MPFQTSVSDMPAAGLVAEKSRLGIIEPIQVAYTADANVKLGGFVYLGDTAGTVVGVGADQTTVPDGLAVGRTLQPTLLEGGTTGMAVPQGQPVQFADKGEYCLVSTTAAEIGHKVLVNGTTGAILTGETTNVGGENYADTGWVVVDLGGTGVAGSILRIRK